MTKRFGTALVAVQIPALARLLHLVPLNAGDWLLVGGLALIPAVVGQALKVARRWGAAEREGAGDMKLRV